MNTFILIAEAVIVLLLLWAIIIVIRNPKEILVKFPLFVFRAKADQFLRLIEIITLPLWLPIYLLDNKFKWGIFELKFFKFFNQYDLTSKSDKPDISYKQKVKIDINPDKFRWFYVSSVDDTQAIMESIKSSLKDLTNKDFKCTKRATSNFSIVQVHNLTLYEYHYIIQALDNDFKKSINVGFALSPKISFFSISDTSTLNNIIGKTSKDESYSFNLVDGQENHLSLNKEIKIAENHSFKTYENVVKKALKK
ncbi:hypothetical protein [Roseivirga thermotolerans]|uniref:hypothetical protein n=1 Tax=Roseivirga thermotolerans TaxID=1758176 RepID=UPI0027401936|nr:hypothetical protein [Roseivirga thermotolerans]